MSQPAWWVLIVVAAIGAAGVVANGIIGLVGNRRVGTPEGSGTLAEMITAALKWQVAHGQQNAEDLAEVQRQIGVLTGQLEERAKIHDAINEQVRSNLRVGTLAGIADDVRELKGSIAQVHQEIRTANGMTLGALADQQEGRRVEDEIPEEDRTASEQGYVDRLDPPSS